MSETQQVSIQDLLKKVSTGKATVSEQMLLSKLLAEQAINQQEEEKESKFQQLRDFAKSIDLSEELILQAFSAPKKLMFEVEINGTKYQRFVGQLGKCTFADLLKKTYPAEEQAKQFIKGEAGSVEHTKGLAFIKNIYNPK